MKITELYKQVRDEQNKPQVNIEEVKTQFNEMLSNFKNHGNVLYNMGKYREIAEYFNKLVENAEHCLISESDSWFDNITIKRNLKELKTYASDFSKASSEAQALQERMASLYEDMGVILNRYFDVPDGQQSQGSLTEARSIGKRNITKLKSIVRHAYSKNENVTVEDIIDNYVPDEWFATWESAYDEIRRIVYDELMNIDEVYVGPAKLPLYQPRKRNSVTSKNLKESLNAGMKNKIISIIRRLGGSGSETTVLTVLAKELGGEHKVTSEMIEFVQSYYENNRNSLEESKNLSTSIKSKIATAVKMALKDDPDITASEIIDYYLDKPEYNPYENMYDVQYEFVSKLLKQYKR